MVRTSLTTSFASGIQVLEVSRRAGHASTSFTLDRYGHLFPNAEDEAADRLAAFVKPIPAAVEADVVPIIGGERDG